MSLDKLFIYGAVTLMLASCGGKKTEGGLTDGLENNSEEYLTSDVNAIDQALPEIMVLPSDACLKETGCLKTKKVDGQSIQIRDFEKYLLKDDNFKPIVNTVQDKFKDKGYPLNDFESTLKSLQTQQTYDIADNLAQDSKTRLLATTHPDIILELDYKAKGDMRAADYRTKKINYTLNGIDAYTNKVIATVSGSGLQGENVASVIGDHLSGQMPKLMRDLQKYFSDLLTRGRDITVRINMDAESNQKLTDESIEGDTYADAIVDYIKTHTVKGTYKMQTNTADELTFSNVRIKVLNNDGTQYGVYDWTRDLQKYLKKNLGLSCENRSQGLGEVVLTVKGVN